MFKENAPLVSIIVVNFNGENYLERCLSSVFSTHYPNFEVIFVDNASTDSSLKIVEKVFRKDSRLRIIRSSQNLGFSGGNNLGFDQAKGDYIVFLNTDTIADPYWLTALICTMEKDKTIGLAGSTILSIDGQKLRGAGGLWSDYLLFLYPIGVGRRGDFEFLPVFEVSFATGCSMIIRKEFLDEIGLFDPEIPYNYDDTLLSLKTWLAGKRVVSVSGSRIRHIGGATINKFWNQQSVAFSLTRSKMCLLFDVYFNLNYLLKAFLILFFSIMVESVFSIRNNKVSNIIGSIRAWMWLMKNFKHVWKNRLDHWKNSKISPEMLIAKFIRIRLNFPLCVARSELTNSIYRDQCLKFENNAIPTVT
jgi:GT2 family glycosyltransferase